MYLDGGWNLAVPNSVVAFGINAGINGTIAALTGGGGGLAVRKGLISSLGARRITQTFAHHLGRFIAIQLANRMAGTIIGLVTGFGGWSIGDFAARWWDSRDKNRNNGWCDI